MFCGVLVFNAILRNNTVISWRSALLVDYREMTTENHRPLYLMCTVYSQQNGHHGHVHMVVGFTTTNVISAYHHWSCEFESRSGAGYSIQHYVIKFISDLRQVCGFLQVLGFHLPIKLTCTKYLKYCWSSLKTSCL